MSTFFLFWYSCIEAAHDTIVLPCASDETCNEENADTFF